VLVRRPGISGMIGSDPVLIRMVSAVIVMRSLPVPAATVWEPTNAACPVTTVTVSAPFRASYCRRGTGW